LRHNGIPYKGKGVEGSIAATHLSHRAVEIGEEALEIDDRRTAVDPVVPLR
jgi:hypothetical protein